MRTKSKYKTGDLIVGTDENNLYIVALITNVKLYDYVIKCICIQGNRYSMPDEMRFNRFNLDTDSNVRLANKVETLLYT